MHVAGSLHRFRRHETHQRPREKTSSSRFSIEDPAVIFPGVPSTTARRRGSTSQVRVKQGGRTHKYGHRAPCRKQMGARPYHRLDVEVVTVELFGSLKYSSISAGRGLGYRWRLTSNLSGGVGKRRSAEKCPSRLWRPRRCLKEPCREVSYRAPHGRRLSPAHESGCSSTSKDEGRGLVIVARLACRGISIKRSTAPSVQFLDDRNEAAGFGWHLLRDCPQKTTSLYSSSARLPPGQ